MKKRFVKKFATLLFVKKNDPDCKCYERDQERHRRYYYKKFNRFFEIAKKRDWYWYYYFQARQCLRGKPHEEAIVIADKCIKDYKGIRNGKGICRI